MPKVLSADELIHNTADLTVFMKASKIEKGWSTPEKKQAGEAPDRLYIEGFASTNDLDTVGDIVHPSAFADTLPQFMEFPNFFFAHKFDSPIGLIERAEIVDDRGLWVRGAVFLDTTLGKDVGTFVEGGALRGLSIQFAIPEGGIHFDEKLEAYHITRLDLYEISIVTLPANRSATFEIAKQIKSWASSQTKYKLGRKPKDAEGTPREIVYDDPILLQELIVAGLGVSAAVSKMRGVLEDALSDG
jgi:HK97 family phage prohead protease